MSIENKIKQRFEGKIYPSNVITRAIKECDDEQINNYLKERLEKEPEWEKISWLVIGIVKGIQLPKCKVCGKNIKYSKLASKQKCCSIECKYKDPEYIQQLHKHKFTKQTIKKRKETNLKKYGVENVSQLQYIKDKKCQTQMKHFGVAYSFQSKELLQKAKQTYRKNYGVDHISQSKDIKYQKHVKRCQLEFKRLEKYKDYVIPKSTLQDYIDGKDRVWTCVKCGKDFVQNKLYTTGHIKGHYQCPRCWDCYPQIFGESRKQIEVYEFIKSIYDGPIEQHNRVIIGPKELDIVLPELKLAIEFNGDYWHSAGVRIDDLYHKDKTILCEQAGYRLIHIFEFEWQSKQELVKNKLMSIICKNIPSIYARKCQIKEIEFKQSDIFLNQNHIQGGDRSPIRLGLFYQDELVAVMTFCKSRFNKNYEWELSKYATSKRVIGGAGKLLKYFQMHYKPKNIVTYADRRYSIGNMYQKIGFKFDHFSEPSYVWSSQNHDIILSRFDVWKTNIKRFFSDYNGQKIEDFLGQKKFNKLYDCGNYVFMKEF